TVVSAYAIALPNKEYSISLPIITSQVANNSVIWTDEH
ncbi:hypothetical protein H311_00283, partial [Anncaliia algerae PRA109]